MAKRDGSYGFTMSVVDGSLVVEISHRKGPFMPLDKFYSKYRIDQLFSLAALHAGGWPIICRYGLGAALLNQLQFHPTTLLPENQQVVYFFNGPNLSNPRIGELSHIPDHCCSIIRNKLNGAQDQNDP